jgi:hypothetical protein
MERQLLRSSFPKAAILLRPICDTPVSRIYSRNAIAHFVAPELSLTPTHLDQDIDLTR